MTATDELRRLLDERGVEWTSGDTEVSRNICTDFRPDAGVTISVCESGDGKLGIDAHTDYRFTPEQAVEATLGRGECRRVPYKPTGVLVCSECGAGIPKQLDKYCYLHYCPNCGRKVVDG